MSDKKFSDTQIGKTLGQLLPVLTPAAQDEMWAAVQENRRKLRECAGPHDFSTLKDPPHRRHYLCTKCGGEVDSINKGWYEAGLKHGRSAP